MKKNQFGFRRRQLLQGAAALPLIKFTSAMAGPADGHGHGIKRLNWAGLMFTKGKTTLLIDPVITDIWGGDSPYPLLEIEPREGRSYALITHTHGDHFDVPGLKKLMGEKGYVYCEPDLAPYVVSRGLRAIPQNHYQPEQRGDFTFIPLPAVDGAGDSQVSWLVSVDGKKYLHGGDSIWHGRWRRWAAAYGPFEAVFLPINGARQADEPASEIPMSLTPREAVDASILLGAKQLVPIHYGFHVEGSYEEVPEPLEETRREAERRGVKLTVLKPGDWLA